MWHLDGQQAVGCQERGDPGHDIVEVRHLCQRVVAGDQVGRPTGSSQLARQCMVEESGERRYTCRLGDERDILGRLDAQYGHSGADEIPEQVSVVAAQLDDEAGRTEVQGTPHLVSVEAGVFEPAVGVRREVRVLREDRLRRHVGRQLDEEAAITDRHPERVEGLHLIELVRAQVALAQRADAKVDHDVVEWRSAEAARMRHTGVRKMGRLVHSIPLCRRLWCDGSTDTGEG